jgi:hypothetical protein
MRGIVTGVTSEIMSMLEVALEEARAGLAEGESRPELWFEDIGES